MNEKINIIKSASSVRVQDLTNQKEYKPSKSSFCISRMLKSQVIVKSDSNFKYITTFANVTIQDGDTGTPEQLSSDNWNTLTDGLNDQTGGGAGGSSGYNLLIKESFIDPSMWMRPDPALGVYECEFIDTDIVDSRTIIFHPEFTDVSEVNEWIKFNIFLRVDPEPIATQGGRFYLRAYSDQANPQYSVPFRIIYLIIKPNNTAIQATSSGIQKH